MATQKSRALKPKKCRWCNEQFTPKVSLQVVCSAKCAVQLSREKELNKKIKCWKEKLKTISEYEKDARKVFQLWIRKRDNDLPCISCGVNESIQWDAGHFYKAEIYSGLIFNEKNVHKQCVRCNRYLHGNDLEYREGIIKRYGIDYFKSLESIKDSKRNYKYTIKELILIRKKYAELLKTI